MAKKFLDSRYMANAKALTDALAKVKTLNVVTYNDGASVVKPESIGISAQDLQPVIPFAVTQDGVGLMFADQSELVPVLVAAIKELEARVTALEASSSEVEETKDSSVGEETAPEAPVATKATARAKAK